MPSVLDFFRTNMAFMYFVSGLALFAMGLVLAMELDHAVDYSFRPALWLLAAFGFVETTRQWLQMTRLLTQGAAVPPGLAFQAVNLTLLAAGFLLLLWYGLRAEQVHRQRNAVRRPWSIWVAPAVVAVWLAGLGAVALLLTPAPAEWLPAANVWTRYILGIPASLLAARAFLLQRRPLAADLRRHYGRYLTIAAWAMVWFAVFDQAIAPESALWPSIFLNQTAFEQFVGLPVQLFRTIVVVVGVYAIYLSLRAVEIGTQREFTTAQRRALQAEEGRRQEAEAHSVQLTRLARELSALLETTRVVASRLDLDSMAQESVQRIVDLFDGVECGCILLVDPSEQRMEVKACVGTEAPCAEATQLAEVVLRTGQGSVTPADGQPSVICVPLISETGTMGCMTLANEDAAGRFGERELQQAQALANQVAVGIEKAWLYREVQRREQLLRRLLERVVAAQEEERKRIARELHDEAGQVLTALVTSLQAVENVLPADAALVRTRITGLRELGVQAMEEIDRLIADLRPTLLDDLGLVAALRWLVESNRDRLPPVKLDMRMGKIRLPANLEVELFRIVQESLKNITRHAKASQVTLSMRIDADQVQLQVEDDGQGFDPQAAMDPLSPRPAWGLFGMRERAEGLGGTMTIDSRLGRGTRLVFNIPLAEESKDEFDPTVASR